VLAKGGIRKIVAEKAKDGFSGKNIFSGQFAL